MQHAAIQQAQGSTTPTEDPAMSYQEFLVYLFDAGATRELAVELAVAIDERQYFEQLSALLV